MDLCGNLMSNHAEDSTQIGRSHPGASFPSACILTFTRSVGLAIEMAREPTARGRGRGAVLSIGGTMSQKDRVRAAGRSGCARRRAARWSVLCGRDG